MGYFLFAYSSCAHMSLFPKNLNKEICLTSKVSFKSASHLMLLRRAAFMVSFARSPWVVYQKPATQMFQMIGSSVQSVKYNKCTMRGVSIGYCRRPCLPYYPRA